jgi:hypothetical protein
VVGHWWRVGGEIRPEFDREGGLTPLDVGSELPSRLGVSSVEYGAKRGDVLKIFGGAREERRCSFVVDRTARLIHTRVVGDEGREQFNLSLAIPRRGLARHRPGALNALRGHPGPPHAAAKVACSSFESFEARRLSKSRATFATGRGGRSCPRSVLRAPYRGA